MRRSLGLKRYGILAVILIALYIFTRNSIGFASPRAFGSDGAPQDGSTGPDFYADDAADDAVPFGGERESRTKKKMGTQISLNEPVDEKTTDYHPVDTLIYDAQSDFEELLSKETKTIQEAAKAYRKRRGRHPPPGFDQWFKFARKHNAIIVEDFFDQIYHDLQPFWAIEPAVLRKESWDWEMTINVRDGKASAGSDWFWTQIWLNMVKSIEHLLPDMDLPVNAMDEPRIVVPYEEVADYIRKAAKTIKMSDPGDVVSKFQKLPAPAKGDLDVPTRARKFEDTKPYWAIARRGCSPDSASQMIGLEGVEDLRPRINSTYTEPHMYRGFVSNFTMSSDLCHQPDLQGLEGIFIHPLSTSSSQVMSPMFGGSKLNVNNEILLPAPMYWNEEERFTGGDDHGIPWAEKKDQVIWRGVATGGLNTEHNWRGFQRHRFVAMNNATKVSRVEFDREVAENFALAENFYHIQAQDSGELGQWIDQWSNVGFTDLNCSPPRENGMCDYTGHYFEKAEGMTMSKQFDSKFLPDIDGNSFSGRYLGFLRSTSLPIKATMWREWHDSRLVAWKHFVPMDNRFVDYYGIMEYFVGFRGKGGHDRAAEKIATDGKEWAEKVLRKEDMSIYVLRLLLEYARLLDDRREHMGWVEDIRRRFSLLKIWTWW